MPKNINKQDLVVIGGGTSGLMCALGAVRYGLKVTLICTSMDLSRSSLLAEVIPTKAFSYVAGLVDQIKQANHFGLDIKLAPINLVKINAYIQKVIQELTLENDFEIFENLGGSLLIGEAKFINNQTILVGNIRINSKYFIIATGTREPGSNILNFDKSGYLKYRQIFYQNNINVGKKTIIIGDRPESLEIAQSLARFGSKIALICSKSKLLPLEDQEIVKKLQNILEKEGVAFYLSTQVVQFDWQNQSKLLVCQDSGGDKFVIDFDEIIDMREPVPNIEELSLQNTKVVVSTDGILVNNRLQTGEKNIFAVGSVVKSPFKSIHLMEQQANVILSNIIFKIARKINYKLMPRILFTSPQLATIGLTHGIGLDNKKNKVLQFNFNKIDAAIYKDYKDGEIKVICKKDQILGVSILGPLASELITEYSFAMQVGAGISDLANSVHGYPTLSQINKRVAHTFFNKNNPSIATVVMEKARHKMHQMASMFSLVPTA